MKRKDLEGFLSGFMRGLNPDAPYDLGVDEASEGQRRGHQARLSILAAAGEAPFDQTASNPMLSRHLGFRDGLSGRSWLEAFKDSSEYRVGYEEGVMVKRDLLTAAREQQTREQPGHAVLTESPLGVPAQEPVEDKNAENSRQAVAHLMARAEAAEHERDELLAALREINTPCPYGDDTCSCASSARHREIADKALSAQSKEEG